MSSCITDLVGITQSTTIPFYSSLTDEVKEDIAISSSGLYMDKLPGGLDLGTIEDEEFMSFLMSKALEARGEAEKILFDDLLVAINNRYQAAKVKFNGDVGRKSVSGTLATTGEFQGQRYRLYEPIAGNIRINKVMVCVNGVATFNIYIYRCDAHDKAVDETPLFTGEVTTVANTWSNVNLTSAEGGKIILPMEIEGVPQEYYIGWKRSEAGMLLPKNNEIKCGTCTESNGGTALDDYMYYNGVSAATLATLSNIQTDKHGHGLSVSAVVGCEHETVICREFNKKENIATLMAWACRYKLGEMWIEYILKGGYVNRDGMMRREELWGKRDHFRAQYEQRITVIANQMTLGETNCYSCKDTKMFMGTIKTTYPGKAIYPEKPLRHNGRYK